MDAAESEDSLGEATQDLYVQNGYTLWPRYSRIPVCFTYGTGDLTIPVANRAEITAFVKERINLTWGSVLPLSFAFRDCPTSGTSQEVMFDLQWHRNGGICTPGMAGVSDAGERAGGDPDGCRIGIDPNWKSSQTAMVQQQRILVHEFGHILGFGHEENRPGATGRCAAPDAPAGGLLLGVADPDSIMLSTGCRDPNQSWLSPNDVVNARSWYSLRTPPTAPKDIAFQSADGMVQIWRMSGTIRAAVDVVPDTLNSAYRVVGTGDLDGDGIGDLLFRGPSGAVLLWLLDASGNRKDTGYIPVSWEWTFQGMGRFNNDTRSDVLWRNTQTGVLVTWMMNGAAIDYARELTAPDQQWQVKLIADFNADGQADLFWRHPNGGTAVWLLNDGSTVLGNGWPGTADTSWSAKAAGDFDGDGTADVFWQRTDGTTSMWFMAGTRLKGWGSPPWVEGAWQVQAVGDVDADGKADLMWRNFDGPNGVWLMDGLSIRLSMLLPSLTKTWKMVGALRGTINPSY